VPRIRKLLRVERIVIEAYTQYDRTMAELAAFYNVSLGTIRNVLRRNKVPARRAGPQRRDGEDVRKYKEDLKKTNESDEQTV
jgi:hypothetical protein